MPPENEGNVQEQRRATEFRHTLIKVVVVAALAVLFEANPVVVMGVVVLSELVVLGITAAMAFKKAQADTDSPQE